ncbi:MAG: metal-dependent hydrolase [Candidatus Aenigmarchaeota archaeon]|nr:metal-dependent hydrolase [Candidatus Aenigmarchaeota archaeon]
MLPIAHIAAPLLCLAIYNKYLKLKKHNSIPASHFIIIGIAGILPDLFSVHIWATQRAGFSHSLLFPLIFFTAYFILKKVKSKYSIYAFLCFIGISIHFILDLVTAQMYLFYPFSMYAVNQFIIMPAHGMIYNNIIYLNMSEHIIWYAADVVFFISFILVEKTTIIERIYSFLYKQKLNTS